MTRRSRRSRSPTRSPRRRSSSPRRSYAQLKAVGIRSQVDTERECAQDTFELDDIEDTDMVAIFYVGLTSFDAPVEGKRTHCYKAVPLLQWLRRSRTLPTREKVSPEDVHMVQLAVDPGYIPPPPPPRIRRRRAGPVSLAQSIEEFHRTAL